MDLAAISAKLAAAQRVAGRVGTVIPRSFTAFATWLGVALTAGQLVLARVAYDGAQPRELTADQRALAGVLFGEIDEVPAHARAYVVAPCGARGGKSYTSAIRLLHGALTRDLSRLAPGERACASIVAPSMKLARQTFRYARGAISARPELEAMVVSDNADGVVLRRPDGKIVEIACLAASRGGAELRSRWHTDALFDECAFFRDADSGVVNDEELFQAVAPRVLRGGQVLLVSTPWARAGLLYQLYRDNFGAPKTALAAHAPTLFLNDSPETRPIVERERLRDPDNARREFDAEFVSASGTLFFDPLLIASAVDPDLTLPRSAAVGETVTVGADFGFRSDSSALCIVHNDGVCFRVGAIDELRPAADAPLKPSTTVAAFASTVRAHGGAYVMADGHYREAIAEHLAEHELGFADAPAGGHVADPFVKARMLMREGRIRIPNHPRLLAQLRAVEARPLSGGGLQISQPRARGGGHGDLVSAFVLALYQSAGLEVEPPEPKPGTPEHDQLMVDRWWKEQEERASEQAAKPWWQDAMERRR